jgi:hypothetical protein
LKNDSAASGGKGQASLGFGCGDEARLYWMGAAAGCSGFEEQPAKAIQASKTNTCILRTSRPFIALRLDRISFPDSSRRCIYITPIKSQKTRATIRIGVSMT